MHFLLGFVRSCLLRFVSATLKPNVVASAPARVGTRYMDALAGEKCKAAGKAPSSTAEGSKVSKSQHPVSAVSL
jgi:hypothetical protein